MQALPFPPPLWPFAPLEFFDNGESNYAREKKLGVEILMRFERVVATHSRICTGGTDIIRARWAAEAILGDKFQGK